MIDQEERIIQINIEDEMKSAYIDYSMSVIAVSYTHLDVYKRQVLLICMSTCANPVLKIKRPSPAGRQRQ